MHCEKTNFSRSKVHTWTNEPARMNSIFPRIANRSLPSAPASRPVSQENLRKWERAARDQSYMCNQAAAFSQCLTRVQDNMASQLKIIQSVTCKGKLATKVSQAADELDFLVTFNCSITQAMARTMQDLSEGVFVNVANLTLARRDSYLEYIKAGIKVDTLTSLRTAPLHLSALFPDHIIAKAEEEIRHHEDKRTSGLSQRKPQCFHPYSKTTTGTGPETGSPSLEIEDVGRDLTGARLPLHFPSDRPRHRSSINDNYCAQFVAGEVVPVCVTGKVNCVVTGVEESLNSVSVTGKDFHSVTRNLKTRTHLPVFCHVVNPVPFAGGLLQKKGVNPEHQRSIKSVKGVFCVNQSSSVQNVTNVPPVVPNLPVGARLHQFWEKWAALGVSPKVLAVLREGYILPFRFWPNLTRTPTVTSCYVNPHRNSYLLEALHQLLHENAVEIVQNPQSLGFYNRLFLVPKPNNRWRPILDLSKLNTFLKTQSFKMETPETIRTSLQTGEWVTSIDFKDVYFHIPINSQSRKYVCFHI